MTEIFLATVAGVLLLLNGWLETRRRKADQQQRQQVHQLQQELDRLQTNVDTLYNDLRLLFPSIKQPVSGGPSQP